MTVPREFLELLRGEYCAATGHWIRDPAAGSVLGHLVRHDSRMLDGSCCTCGVVDLLDGYLYAADLQAQTAAYVDEHAADIAAEAVVVPLAARLRRAAPEVRGG